MLPQQHEDGGTRPPAPPPQLLLVSCPESVRAARDFAREFVAYHVPGAAEEYVENVRLIVSELVTNSVRYGTEPGDSVLLVLAVADSYVRVEVRDPMRRRPCFRGASDERGRGRGLFIVAALAARWGVAERPFGKAVWAQVAR